MNLNWIQVLVASFFEVWWVIGLTHAHNFLTWSVTIGLIILSTYLMMRAGRYLPVGTVYAVFVGLGTAGTVISEIVFFGEPFKWSKILFILLLLLGVVGLKLVTKDDFEEEGEH